MKESFVHLHVHSHYSMMWGVSSVKTLCRKAAEAGNEYLALTDTNGLYGLIRFLEAARQYGIQPIVGANLQTHHPPLVTQIVVLAKTPKGYELLTELLSQRHLDKDFSLLRSFPGAPEDLAVLSSDPDIIKALRSRAECWVEAVPGPAGRQALKLAALLEVPPLPPMPFISLTRMTIPCTASCGPLTAIAP